MRQRKIILRTNADKVCAATGHVVCKVDNQPTTTERIIQLRKELGQDLKQAQRDFSFRLGMRSLNIAQDRYIF